MICTEHSHNEHRGEFQYLSVTSSGLPSMQPRSEMPQKEQIKSAVVTFDVLKESDLNPTTIRSSLDYLREIDEQ